MKGVDNSYEKPCSKIGKLSLLFVADKVLSSNSIQIIQVIFPDFRVYALNKMHHNTIDFYQILLAFFGGGVIIRISEY